MAGDDEGRAGTWRHLRTDPQFLLPMLVIVLLAAIAIAPEQFGAGERFDCSLDHSLEGPSAAHPFGYDIQGCDYYTQTLLGARSSLVIGFTVVAVAVPLGLLLGSLMGYFEGWLDAAIGRLADIFFAVPLVFGGAVALTIAPGQSVLQVALVLVVFAWPPMVRLVRSSVLVTKRETYVEAARALGASDLRILRRHVIPNALGPVLVYASVYVGVAITAEAVLSFMGVGLELPAVSWGLMLSRISFYTPEAPHLLFPAVLLTVTVGAFVLLGESLRRAFNPARH